MGEDRFFRLVGEGQIFKLDPLGELRLDVLPLVGHVLMEGLRQLVHEPKGGLGIGVEGGQALDGGEDVIQKLHKDEGGAGGDALAGEGQGRRHQEHADLQDAPGDVGGIAHVHSHLGPLFGSLGHGVVAAAVEAGDAVFRLEALDHRKAGQGVLEHAGVGLLLVGDRLLRLGRLVTEDDGHQDGEQGKPDGDQRQQGAVPEHEPQGAQKGDDHLQGVLQSANEILLDGVHVVGEGGEVEGGVLAGEGLDALVEEPVEDVGPILAHGLRPEPGQESMVQRPAQRDDPDGHGHDDQQCPHGVGAFAGD